MENKVIPTPVATVTLDALNIKNIHEEGYISKETLGNALGLSNKAIKKAKRDDLIEKMRSKLLEEASVNKEEEVMVENKNAKSVVTDKTRKVRDMINRIMYAKNKNLEKGYGAVISVSMLNDIVLRQFDIYNARNALKHDMRVREAILRGEPNNGEIYITDEILNNLATTKQWLIKYKYISEEIRYVENKDSEGNVKYKLPIYDVLEGPIQ